MKLLVKASLLFLGQTLLKYQVSEKSVFRITFTKYRHMFLGIIASISNTLGIPHFIAHWEPPEVVVNRSNRQYTRNFFPSSNLFSRALGEIIVDYDWTAFTIIYDSRESLTRLHDVLQIHGPSDNPVTVRELPDNSDYKPLLKEVALSGETRILLGCSPDKVAEIVKQAIGVKMMEEYQVYIADRHLSSINH